MIHRITFFLLSLLLFQCNDRLSEKTYSAEVYDQLSSRLDSMNALLEKERLQLTELREHLARRGANLDSLKEMMRQSQYRELKYQKQLKSTQTELQALVHSSRENEALKLKMDSLIGENTSLVEALAIYQDSMYATRVNDTTITDVTIDIPQRGDKQLANSDVNKTTSVDTLVDGRGGVREAFRLYLLRLEAEKSDPTIALNLGLESVKYHPDEIIKKSNDQLFQNNRFYTIRFQTSKGIRSAAMYSDSLMAMVLSDSTLVLHNLMTNDDQIIPGKNYTSVTFGNAGYYTGSFDGSIIYYSFNRNEKLEYEGHNNHVLHLAYNSRTSNLISSGMDKKIRIWNADLSESKSLVGHTGQIDDLDVHHPYLLSTANDLEPRLWNMTGKLLLRFRKQPLRVTASAVNPFDNHLITADEAGNYRIWSIGGDLLYKNTTDIGAIHAVSNSAHSYTAFGGSKGTVLLTDSLYVPMMLLKGHTDEITWLHFESSGRYLYSASLDGTFRKWDIEPGDRIESFTAFERLTEEQKTYYKIRD